MQAKPLETVFLEFVQKYPQERVTNIFEHLVHELLYRASNPRIFVAEHKTNEQLYKLEDLEALCSSVYTHSEGYKDALGDLYMYLSSSGQKSHMGQFFTPQSISDMCAQITGAPLHSGVLFGDITGCGSGRNILGVSQKMGKSQTLLKTAFGVDLDSLCVKIATFNLWANAIPGYIMKGDAIEYEKIESGYNINVHCYKDKTRGVLMNIPYVRVLSAEEIEAYKFYMRGEFLQDPKPTPTITTKPKPHSKQNEPF